MIVKEIWDKLNPQEKHRMYEFLTSDFFTLFADAHMNTFAASLLNLNPDDVDFKNQYASRQRTLNVWQEFRHFVQSLTPEEF